MSSPRSSSKGKEPEVPYTPSTPPSSPSSSSPSSPEAKRRRLEPVGDAHVYGEPFVVRSSSSAGSWAWYPDMIRGWIREERVPSFEFLPRLRYPLEQAFAAFVAKMDREIQQMREAAGAITGLLRDGLAMEKELKSLREGLAATRQVNANLVARVNELGARVATAEHGLVQAQVRIAELEAQEEADDEEEEEDPEEDPEEVPGADEVEGEEGGGEVLD